MKSNWMPRTKLTQLLEYGFPRAVGHTWSEINGVKNNPNSVLIIANHAQKQHIDLPPNKMITLSEIPEKLMGLRKAVIIDHYALSILVEKHNQDILKALEEKLEGIEDITEVWKDKACDVWMEGKSMTDLRVCFDDLAHAIRQYILGREAK